MMISVSSFSAVQVIDESVPPRDKLISIDFPDTPLRTVISVLSLKTGYKFITDSELAKKQIVLSLKDVTAEEALSALLDTYNLYYVRQGETNIYVIKSKSDTVVTTVSKVFFLNFPTAKDIMPTLANRLSKSGSISADEKSNSIVVTDMANNIDEIDQLIKTLDIPPLQVLLEAKIIDVKLGSTLQYGIDTTLYRTNNYYKSPLDIQNGVVSNFFPQVGYAQTFAPGLTSAGSLRVSLLSGDMNIQAYLQALQQDSNAKILSNPRLVVINNKEAMIDIIEEIPYSASTQTGVATGVTSTSVAFKEVGIKLKVKPQINRDGTIILEVSPEESFRTGEAIDGTPVISTSKTNTTFMIQNGETAVIGGLVKETDTVSIYKIPLLGDIPILGALFRKYSKEKIRSELTVLITAKILR